MLPCASGDAQTNAYGLRVQEPSQYNDFIEVTWLLTEDAWTLLELKEAIAKMKTNKSGHDVEVVVEFVQPAPQSHCA